jgi:hypothetical protein
MEESDSPPARMRRAGSATSASHIGGYAAREVSTFAQAMADKRSSHQIQNVSKERLNVGTQFVSASPHVDGYGGVFGERIPFGKKAKSPKRTDFKKFTNNYI